MLVGDATSGRLVSSHAIGDHLDVTGFDAKRALVSFSNGDGTLSIFHQESPDKYQLLENVRTRFGARTMALDPKTGRAFLSVADLGPTPGSPQPRAAVLPGTFSALVFGK